MKKLVMILVVAVLAMASVASAGYVDTVGGTMNFSGDVQMDFVNYTSSSTPITGEHTYAATQEATMTSIDAGFESYSLVISSTTSLGTTTAGIYDVAISWEILNGTTSVLTGTMENFGFADSSGNPAGVPSGSSGSGIYTLADYATTGLWQAEGFSSGGWVGSYWEQPLWTGTVAITPSAVPEPATMCLLGLGGLLLRRKK